MSRVHLVVLQIILLFPSGVIAGSAPPGGGFSLPIDCVLGTDCWVMNYPDRAPGKGAADFTCGSRSYDGHKGIDFAIRDVRAMRRGVDVLASAEGMVRGVRDEVADRRMRTEADRTVVRGKECGNGVVVDHGGGWETQYCHMQRGSLAVRVGQRVGRRQPLGKVGLSGRTEFPHVHLTVRRDGTVLDPANGQPLNSGCSSGGTSLWRKPERLAYQPMALFAVGFSTGAVKEDAVKRDAASPERLSATAPALVLWATAFGVRKGDRLSLTIIAPDGRKLHNNAVVISRNQAWRLSYGGKRRKQVRWPAGRYRGEAVLRRRKNDTAVTLRKHIYVSVQ
jgi:hypothetical protein